MTFTLTGFSTVKREGIELTGSFTATVNADLKVGALEETITVSGETPIVDVQSVRRQTTISNDIDHRDPGRALVRRHHDADARIRSRRRAPHRTSRSTPGMVVFGGAGGRSNEGRLQVDGLNIGAAFNGGGVSALHRRRRQRAGSRR